MTAPILGHEVERRVGFVGEFGYRRPALAHTLAEITLEADPRPGARDGSGPIPLPRAPWIRTLSPRWGPR